jgi:RNA polymerase sigma-70 factor (ECF subfamily)
MGMPTAMAKAEEVANDELLIRARTGDAEAFGRLLAPEEARLFRQALALCGEIPVAEDLVVETMVGAWQGLSRFDGGCRLSTWLYAILLHRFQKHVRRLRSRLPSAASLVHGGEVRPPGQGEPELERVVDPGATGAEAALQAETAARLRAAVAELPEEHRSVLLLRFFEEASLEEIASALGIPVGTVKSRLHHGLEKLRRMEAMVNLRTEWRDS